MRTVSQAPTRHQRADKLKAYIAEHKTANTGQISVESIEQQKAEIIAGLVDAEGAGDEKGTPTTGV